jgi:hypothetical protein
MRQISSCVEKGIVKRLIMRKKIAQGIRFNMNFVKLIALGLSWGFQFAKSRDCLVM